MRSSPTSMQKSASCLRQRSLASKAQEPASTSSKSYMSLPQQQFILSYVPLIITVISVVSYDTKGAFLPWHRYLIHTHEYALKTECNYTGTQPYWQESLDAGNFTHSIVLDPEIGFGGDGAGPNDCIKDGPFKDYVNAVGPGQSITDHCINRQINDCISVMAIQSNVDQCMAMQNFSMMWQCLEDSPHKAGHGGIGGQEG
jgi:hypothetical protein